MQSIFKVDNSPTAPAMSAHKNYDVANAFAGKYSLTIDRSTSNGPLFWSTCDYNPTTGALTKSIRMFNRNLVFMLGRTLQITGTAGSTAADGYCYTSLTHSNNIVYEQFSFQYTK